MYDTIGGRSHCRTSNTSDREAYSNPPIDENYFASERIADRYCEYGCAPMIVFDFFVFRL